MSATRTRSLSPRASVKRQKLFEDVKINFDNQTFDPENIKKQAEEYRSSGPFKHCRVDALFQDALLENVKDECINELAFTEKETDIYKVGAICGLLSSVNALITYISQVFQTGDLASLDYIDKEQLARLQSLHKLRDSLYSYEFREYLRKVTGGKGAICLIMTT